MRKQLAAFADEAADTLKGQITALKENNIPCLEIRNVNGKSIADLSVPETKEIKKQLDAENITVWSIGSPYGKISIYDDFAPHLDAYKHGLELAEILDTRHLRLFSFYIPDPALPETGLHDLVMERLSQFIEAARGYNITLCHENEKGIYGSSIVHCLEIHQNFPEIKAVFDPANFIQCGQDTMTAWKSLSPFVEYMHIKDARPDGFVVPAGEGCGNISALLQEYRGAVLTVEPHLAVFSGLSGLEKEKIDRDKFVYSSRTDAFRAAVEALKKLMQEDA
ncbi:MAG: sugar phosphate isomerase/epimerase [Roseburia sp.]|nr:sugar phosphate isomerase/epimerase [Roseburia sp.]MCM1242086.1 sugar phosphate isomerase/epimerase [Roseburia sp.]